MNEKPLVWIPQSIVKNPGTKNGHHRSAAYAATLPIANSETHTSPT